MQCSIKELRQKTREILALVEQGEEVIITIRGVETARLLPLATKKKATKRAKSGFGMWKDREDMNDSTEYVRKLRMGRFHDR